MPTPTPFTRMPPTEGRVRVQRGCGWYVHLTGQALWLILTVLLYAAWIAIGCFTLAAVFS